MWCVVWHTYVCVCMHVCDYHIGGVYMSLATITLNPQLVTAKAMAKLRPIDREHVVFCQQAYIPLSGTLVKKLRQVTGERATDVR